jgi:hypothetical protein
MAMSSETPRVGFSGAHICFAERPRRDYGCAAGNKKARCTREGNAPMRIKGNME